MPFYHLMFLFNVTPAPIYFLITASGQLITGITGNNDGTAVNLGRHIRETVNGIVANFLWDEDNISLEAGKIKRMI